MKQITNENKIIGKKITDVIYDDQDCYIILGDEFFALHANCDYPVEINFDHVKMDLEKNSRTGLENLMTLKIIDHGRYIELREFLNKKYEQEEKEKDYQKYLELKEKFEGKE